MAFLLSSDGRPGEVHAAGSVTIHLAHEDLYISQKFLSRFRGQCLNWTRSAFLVGWYGSPQSRPPAKSQDPAIGFLTSTTFLFLLLPWPFLLMAWQEFATQLLFDVAGGLFHVQDLDQAVDKSPFLFKEIEFSYYRGIHNSRRPYTYKSCQSNS